MRLGALRAPAFLLAVFFLEEALPGRVARLAAVFFFELRALVLADFFFVDFFDEAFEADFFRVTFFPEPLRFADDFAAFFPVFFAVAFFLETFFLLEVFFLLEAFVAFFFRDTVFFLLVFFLLAFFLLAFFALAVAFRADLRPAAAFFETFFLVAAFFFFGILRILRWLQNQAGDYT